MAQIKLITFTKQSESAVVIMRHFSEAIFETLALNLISWPDGGKDDHEKLMMEMQKSEVGKAGINLPSELDIGFPSFNIVSNILIFSAVITASLQSIFQLVSYLEKLGVQFVISEEDGKIVR